jgi:hypothetical protein
MKFLATINANVEVEMFRELLESKEIIINAKHRETGEYMLIAAGTTIFGEDLYVSEDQYEEALALYEAYFSGKANIDQKDLEEQALHADNPEELFYDETNDPDEKL